MHDQPFDFPKAADKQNPWNVVQLENVTKPGSGCSEQDSRQN
jgi:hypothetical protein